MKPEDQIGSWSAAQLSDYVNGRMSSADSHRLERDMLDDPFLNDAVEGFHQAESGLDMADLNERWKARNSSSNTGGSSVLGPIAIGISVVALIGIGAMFVQQQEVEDMAEDVSQSMEETRAQEIIYTDSLEVMEIQLAQVIIAEKEIRPEATRMEQSAIEELKESQDVPERMDPPQAIDPLGYPDMEPESGNLEVKEPRPEVFYLHDFKMADHRPEYETELYIRGEWMTGTAARYEREQEGLSQIPEIEQVSYEDVLSDAMEKFGARDYKGALLTLKRIEKRHSNDANVAFYGGLCYYNLSKWSKADLYFRRALDHQSRVFDQESRWHLSLSLIDQEKYERARHHLRTIIEDDEFYAGRAEQLLEGLKKIEE